MTRRARRASAGADALVIPGVGAFGACIRALTRTRARRAIRDFVGTGRPVFGVCVGMQVLFEGSDEDPEEGLSIVPGRSRKLPPERQGAAHGMEHRRLGRAATRTSPAIPSGTRFYFVHSYAPDVIEGTTVGVTEYGRPFSAVVAQRQRVRDAVPPGEVGRRRAADLRVVREGGGGRMIVIPAIDLRGGGAVRLVRGDPRSRDRVLGRPGRGGRAVPGGGCAPAARRRPRRGAGAGLEHRGREGHLPRASRSPCRSAAASVRSSRSRRCSSTARPARSSERRRRPRRRVRRSSGGGVRRARRGRARRPRRSRHDARLDRGRARARGRRRRRSNETGAARYLVTAIARDGTLEGPGPGAVRARAEAHRPAGDRVGRRPRRRRRLGAPRPRGAKRPSTGKALYERTLKLSQVIRG